MRRQTESIFPIIFWRRYGLILAALLVCASANGQRARKEIQAHRITEKITLDGELSETSWNEAPKASDFTQFRPNPGKPSMANSEVSILFDDKAIYIGALLEDTAPDSILKQLSNRDDEANADFFEVYLDTYNDGINSFIFNVSAAGVQTDARLSPVGMDMQWNAVWTSEVRITEKGWIVELRIPYSAIRFPDIAEQVWGIQFNRRIRRVRENSSWNPVDPSIDESVNQMGLLKGIKDIESPLRLAFFPYVSAYLEHYPYDDPDISNYATSFNGGMDVKYGLSDAFTLDMTLIPDFGQVQSDNQVLNLSPFEVRFNENRQFFTEGTEIYNKGGWFYSRRIGGQPIGLNDIYDQMESDEVVVENPQQSQLINATKISGRTKGGTGIGIFNGVTKEMNAIVENENGERRSIMTDPLSNYNVFVIDQSLKNNSFVTLVNTNVMRQGAFYDANLTGGLFELSEKTNTWGISGRGALSQKYGAEFEIPELGYTWGLSAGKRSGNFTFEAGIDQMDDVYDPNDLGFNWNNNQRNAFVEFGYNTWDPFWKINATWSSLEIYYGELFRPNEFSDFGIGGNFGMAWRTFNANGINFSIQPIETFDYFEPRVPGRHYTIPKTYDVGGFFSSDYRKPFALDFGGFFKNWDMDGRYGYNWNVSPRLRFGDRLMVIPEVNASTFFRNEAAAIQNNGDNTIIDDDIIFAIRDEITWENIINASYIFTNRMGVTFRLRHYNATISHHGFKILNEDGSLGEEVLGLDHADYDNNFDAFNIDMVYRWVFAPGSEINIVWKNSIFRYDNVLAESYFRALGQTLDAPQTNSLSIKILYYLDYEVFSRKDK